MALKAKPRAFFMCVGTRDPYWAQRNGKTVNFANLGPDDEPYKREGPILTFFANFLPPPQKGDRIFLFSTQSGRDPTAIGGEETKEVLEDRYPGVHVAHWVFPKDLDPSEFTDVYKSLNKFLDRAVASMEKDYDFIVFVSPGTPQMQAAWYALAHAGRIRGKLFRIFFQENTGQPRVQEVDLGPLIITRMVNAAFHAFCAAHFKEAIQIFSDLKDSLLGPSQRAAAFCAELAHLYDQWMALNYGKASSHMQNLRNNYRDFLRNPNLREHLNKAEDALQKARQGGEAHLLTLLGVAQLRFDQGHYAEALWRAASIVETAELALARNAGYRGLPSRSMVHDFLIQHNLPHAISQEKEAELFKRRNLSLHQGRTVTRESAEEALNLAREAINNLYPALQGQEPELSRPALESLAHILQEFFA